MRNLIRALPLARKMETFSIKLKYFLYISGGELFTCYQRRRTDIHVLFCFLHILIYSEAHTGEHFKQVSLSTVSSLSVCMFACFFSLPSLLLVTIYRYTYPRMKNNVAKCFQQ